ncbi:MAG: 50S ribosomal protein L19 [Candidatus Paceibacterota bacterium]
MKDKTMISPVNMEERKALDLRSGDTVKVYQKVPDKDGKFRTQIFEGLIIAKKHGKEAGGTFTVRRTAGGYGVEKIYPIYSPMIEKIEITKRAKVRQSKLYFIRRKAVKEMNKRMKTEILRLDKTEKKVAPVVEAEA